MDATETVRQLLIGAPPSEDELARALRALTREQAHTLALAALSQYDAASDRRHRDIEEFLGCLVVSVPGCLQGLHGELLARDSLWLHPLYLGADADTRDALLRRAKGDEPALNGVLCALAWIGDEGVQAAFRAWREHPPEWRKRLYIPPEAYAPEAGWELDAEGNRRDLFYHTAYELTPGENTAEPSPVTVVTPLDERCRWCGRPLTAMFDLDLRDPRMAFLGLEESWLRLATCEWCSEFTPVYVEFDLSGGARWSAYNEEQPDILRKLKVSDDGSMFFESPRRMVLGPQRRTPYEANVEGIPLRQSQLGGHPTWIQDAEYPTCPSCRLTMLNVGQVATEELLGVGEGITYVFLCPTCRLSATTFQQT